MRMVGLAIGLAVVDCLSVSRGFGQGGKLCVEIVHFQVVFPNDTDDGFPLRFPVGQRRLLVVCASDESLKQLLGGE